MSRENRCIKDENGNEVWISRSSVVIPVVFKMDSEGDIYTLIEKRGPAVTHTGEWCCPCGYMDWDESLEEACQREVYEETSVLLNLENIKFFDATTNKYSKLQNIDHWYECWTDGDVDFNMDKIITKDEVLDLHWLRVGKYKKKHFPWNKDILTIYTSSFDCLAWAFRTHKSYIVKMLENHFDNCNIKKQDYDFQISQR